MNKSVKYVLQFCGVILAVWLFAIGFVIGGALIVILGLILFGLDYLSGGKVIKVKNTVNEINTIDVKTIIKCPTCNAKLRVPTNKKIEVTCKFCKHKWVIET